MGSAPGGQCPDTLYPCPGSVTASLLNLEDSDAPSVAEGHGRLPVRSAIPLRPPQREAELMEELEEPRRRVLNVVVAAVGIVMTLPLMAIIALAIRLSSPGPVLFTQPRIGVDRRRGTPPQHILELRREDLGGRVFTIYKFRTMKVQAGPQAQVWASEDDPRITAVGRLLRKSRLDELPQLFNVLQGDMNIVGPRPEQPRIFQELRERIDGYQQRQKVLPGITGWAQVNQSYDQDLDDVRRKVALDLQYIEERSVVRDFMIMLRTIPVMLFRKGAL